MLDLWPVQPTDSGAVGTVFRGRRNGIPGLLERYAGAVGTVFRACWNGISGPSERYQVRGFLLADFFLSRCILCEPLPVFSTCTKALRMS